MKLLGPAALFLAGSPIVGSAALPSQDQFAEACAGSEQVRVGGQPAQTAPYTLTFSADLAKKAYCYGACDAGQTYPISGATAAQVVLADLDTADQMRHIVFDRTKAQLTDDQRIVMGSISVTRHASAVCKPAAFRSPWATAERRAPLR